MYEVKEKTAMPNAEQVAAYLQSHPEFFEQHWATLANMQLPHPHGGHAVSISERQVLLLREKNRLLETKLSELIRFGEENDAIGEKVHQLACALAASHAGLGAAMDTLYHHLRENFAVPHELVRVWATPSDGEQRPELADTAPEMREFVASMTHPYCGPQMAHEIKHWFGEASSHLKSFAAVPLKRNRVFGLLVLASEDAQRFYPEMGTLYLSRIGELASAALTPYLADT